MSDSSQCKSIYSNKSIAENELWLHENSKALKAVQEGLKQSKKGQVRSRGSFAKYVKAILKSKFFTKH